MPLMPFQPRLNKTPFLLRFRNQGNKQYDFGLFCKLNGYTLSDLSKRTAPQIYTSTLIYTSWIPFANIFPLISRRSFYIFPSPILFLFITRSLSSSLALPLSKFRLILNLMFADPNTSKADRRCLVVLTSMCVNLSSNRLIFQAPIHA